MNRASEVPRTLDGLQPPRTTRLAAGVLGLVAAGAGIAAVFTTTNELGTAALLLVGGAFLICATFGLVPTRLRIGENEMTVGRAALNTLERIVSEADAPTQEKVLDTMTDELAAQGVTRTPDEAVSAMLDRFTRYAGSELARQLHDVLVDDGWIPSTPAKSTYIRWTYRGTKQQASCYQNSAQLVVASNRLVEVVRDLDGAEHRMPNNEVIFIYTTGIEKAHSAAQQLQHFANGEVTPRR